MGGGQMPLEVVSQIKINGDWVNQDEIPKEQFQKIIAQVLDQAMKNIGFERQKTS